MRNESLVVTGKLQQVRNTASTIRQELNGPDANDSSFVHLECLDQGIDTFDIQVVGRLKITKFSYA